MCFPLESDKKNFRSHLIRIFFKLPKRILLKITANLKHTFFFVEKFGIKIFFRRKYLKKNRKIVFAYVSEYCATFRTKNPILPLLESRGDVCRSSSRKTQEHSTFLPPRSITKLFVWQVCKLCKVLPHWTSKQWALSHVRI